jgi:hypothetical protein
MLKSILLASDLTSISDTPKLKNRLDTLLVLSVRVILLDNISKLFEFSFAKSIWSSCVQE